MFTERPRKSVGGRGNVKRYTGNKEEEEEQGEKTDWNRHLVLSWGFLLFLDNGFGFGLGLGLDMGMEVY